MDVPVIARARLLNRARSEERSFDRSLRQSLDDVALPDQQQDQRRDNGEGGAAAAICVYWISKSWANFAIATGTVAVCFMVRLSATANSFQLNTKVRIAGRREAGVTSGSTTSTAAPASTPRRYALLPRVQGAPRGRRRSSGRAPSEVQTVCARIRPVKVLSSPTVRAIVNHAPASTIGGIMWKTMAQAEENRPDPERPAHAVERPRRQGRDGEAEERAEHPDDQGIPVVQQEVGRLREEHLAEVGQHRGEEELAHEQGNLCAKAGGDHPDHGQQHHGPATSRASVRRRRDRRPCGTRSCARLRRRAPKAPARAEATREDHEDRHGRAIADAVLGEEALEEREAHHLRRGSRPSAVSRYTSSKTLKASTRRNANVTRIVGIIIGRVT